ncbi:hypothetical protein DAEQUDRAFT_812781 [Daedalea quercina L-15889]|uniref:MYND-type domain-containing protein n=1 Tax=Daedalea quercina L-15889 TaxID=1314783 RepID=A0A165NZ78_9APHY|nr:hypothetical protein DAEQUDRAFT_812781 [Daedalea quercina L-15889]
MCRLFLPATFGARTRASIGVCTCSVSSLAEKLLLRSLHNFQGSRHFTFEDLIHALARHLAFVLNDAVYSRTVGGVSAMHGLKRNSKKRTGNPLWPVDSSQLCPHGLEQSMKGYAASFALCRNDRFQDVLALVNRLLAICGRSIIPHLIETDPHWPFRVTGLALSLLQERKKTLGRPISVTTQFSWWSILMLLMELCGNISNTELGTEYEDMLVFTRMLARDHRNNIRGCGLLFVCDAILRDLSLFLDGTTLFDKDMIFHLSIGFASTGAVFYAVKPDEDITVYHPSIVKLHATEVAQVGDPLHIAFQGFIWTASARRCCTPECQETFATASRVFARCAGCGVLRYCSRECQVRSWKHAELPHKAVCTKLRVLKERTKLPNDLTVALPRYRQSFIEACKADEGLTALAQDCAKHMLGLMTAGHNNDRDSAPDEEVC